MRRQIRKPFSEMSAKEQIAEARTAIAHLRHPHNRYSSGIYDAIARWNEVLKRHGQPTE